MKNHSIPKMERLQKVWIDITKKNELFKRLSKSKAEQKWNDNAWFFSAKWLHAKWRCFAFGIPPFRNYKHILLQFYPYDIATVQDDWLIYFIWLFIYIFWKRTYRAVITVYYVKNLIGFMIKSHQIARRNALWTIVHLKQY